MQPESLSQPGPRSKPDRGTMLLTGNQVFPIGLGTGRLRSLNGGLSARGAERLLLDAFDQGIRFVDTAPSYGQGQAEAAIGRLPRRVRDELIICSKVGYHFGRKALVINALKPLLRPVANSVSVLRRLIQKSRDGMQKHGSLRADIRPATIRASLTRTLRRLRRQRLDIFMLHDPSIESIGEPNRAELASLKREGVIEHWGVSTDNPAVARLAIGLAGLAFLQVPVEPTWVAGNGDLLAECHGRGIGVIANHVLSPLGSRAGAKLSRDETQGLIAECYGFALRQPAVRMALCGTTSSAHLASNLQSVRPWLETDSVAEGVSS
jgi:aryl-alcohol dehydrogenase-like predicted oxidoreductase